MCKQSKIAKNSYCLVFIRKRIEVYVWCTSGVKRIFHRTKHCLPNLPVKKEIGIRNKMYLVSSEIFLFAFLDEFTHFGIPLN